jgi:porin
MPVMHLTRKVNGQQKGYSFDLGYTGESATLLDSSRDASHATEFTGQLALAAGFDLEKILGWQDTEAKIALTWRDGHNLSNRSDALAGGLGSVQEVYGRSQTWRLTDFWIKKKFLAQKLDIKVGRFGQAEDFSSADCNFQNLALCGSQVGNWDGGQWYNWPVSQWALRVKYHFNPELFAQVGVYEHNPENLARGKGFNLSTDGSDGATIPVEVVWQPHTAVNGLAGEYRAGYSFSTVDQNSLINSNRREHAGAAWISAKQQLTAHHGDQARGLTVSAQATFYDKDLNSYSDMQNIALAYRGFADSRPQDEIAIGFSRLGVNDRPKQVGNVDAEYSTEIYYGIHATNWLTVRPNVQYISHIGGLDTQSDDAWVGGIKLITAF